MFFDDDDTSLLLDLVEKLLSMGPDLGTGPSLDILLHTLPVFPEKSKAYKICCKIGQSLLTQYELLVFLLGPSTHGRASSLFSPVVFGINGLGIEDPLDISLVDLRLLSIFTQAVVLACPR